MSEEVNTVIQNCIQRCLKDVSFNDTYASGYVNSKEELDQFLKEYRVVSGVSFSVRNSRNTGEKAVSVAEGKDSSQGRKLYWSLNTKSHPIPFIGTPFMVKHFQIRDCIFGKHYYKPGSASTSTTTTAIEHAYHTVLMVKKYVPK